VSAVILFLGDGTKPPAAFVDHARIGGPVFMVFVLMPP